MCVISFAQTTLKLKYPHIRNENNGIGIVLTGQSLKDINEIYKVYIYYKYIYTIYIIKYIKNKDINERKKWKIIPVLNPNIN